MLAISFDSHWSSPKSPHSMAYAAIGSLESTMLAHFGVDFKFTLYIYLSKKVTLGYLY